MAWKKVKLGEILKRRRSIERIFPEKEYKLVTIKLYHKGVVLRNTTKGFEIKSTMSSIREGDFILSGIDARNGAFGIVPKELDGAIITNDFWCLEPDEKMIDKEFLLYLSATNFFDYICKQSSDGTTQRIRLQKDRFFNYTIHLPSIQEQKIILKNLNSIGIIQQNISTELTHQLTLVKKLRQQLLQDAVQGKLVEQNPKDEPASELLKKIKAEKEKLIAEKKLKKEKELPPIKPEEIPFDIPENWVWCRLGEIISFGPSNGYSPKESKKGTGIKCLTLTATTSGVFKAEHYKLVDEQIQKDSYLWLESGDILIQRGNSIDYVGIAALYEGEPNNFIYPDLMIKIRLPIIVSTKFIHQVLISPFCRKYYSNNAFGAQKSMPKINQGVVLNTLIPLPPLSEQNRIVQKLEELMQYCNELEASIKQSELQNSTLLQQVLREALRKEPVGD